MKKINLVLAVISVLMVISCSPKKKIDYVILKGVIQNHEGVALKLKGVDTSTIDLKVSEQGVFTDTLMAGEIGMYLGRTSVPMYALPGNVIEITLDAKDINNSLKFAGDLASFNQYLQVKNDLSKAERAKMQENYSLNEASFMKVAKENTAALMAEFKKVTGIPDSLMELESKSVEMKYYADLITYTNYYPYFSKNESYKPSEILLGEFSKVDMDDEKLAKYSGNYYVFLQGYTSIKGRQLYEKEGLSSEQLGFMMELSKFNSEFIKNRLSHITLLRSLSNAEDKDALYEVFKQCCTDEKKMSEVTELYHTVSKLNKGMPSPKFVDYENCAGGTSSLDDFKGKYVYIDVWATWCGPCRGEIPHLQKVEHKYHGKNIEFVSISVDVEKDKEKWKKMVADKELGGVQLIANNKVFTDAYAVSGIPRFILIDPKGNIVSKSAPRPSNPELITLFDELGI